MLGVKNKDWRAARCSAEAYRSMSKEINSILKTQMVNNIKSTQQSVCIKVSCSVCCKRYSYCKGTIDSVQTNKEQILDTFLQKGLFAYHS